MNNLPWCRFALFILLVIGRPAIAGSVEYAYDDLGRLKSVTYADGTTINYTLDPTGNRQTTSTLKAAGNVQFTAQTGTVTEGTANIVLTVARAGGSTGAISVAYATADGNATSGSDYTATSGTLNWANGDSANKSITIPILNDAAYEADEGFIVNLSSPGGGALLGPKAMAIVTISQNDIPANGLLQFSQSAYALGEGGGSATITVQRTNSSTGAVSVQYATVDANALAGSDYTAASGTLNWTAGNTTAKTFTVPVNNDTAGEPNETINLVLSNATGGAVLGRNNATLTINDNEAGRLQFAVSTRSVAEGDGSIIVDVVRVDGVSGAASVNYATANGSAVAGSDFTATSGTLNWTAGVGGPRSITVPILDDAGAESSETFTVTLSSPTGATLGSPATMTVTIADADSLQPGTVSISPANVSVVEGVGTASIIVTRTGGAEGPITLHFSAAAGSATAGADFTPISGVLVWANGEAASKVFAIPIVNDATGEPSETVALSIENPTHGATLGTASGTLTILDDEAGVLQFSATAFSGPENVSPLQVSVQRASGTIGTVGVSYATSSGTALSGTDFTSTSGTLSWANGDASTKTINVPLVNDVTFEGNETFTVTLSAPTGGASIGGTNPITATILDDDGPGVPANLRSNPATLSLGGSFTILWDAATGTVHHYTLYEEITAGQGTGTVQNYTVTPPATSKAFSKGGGERTWFYKVRACSSNDESVCSAWSTPDTIDVCPAQGCP